MTLSHDKRYLASVSLDDIVKIIDVSHLADRPKDGTFDVEAYEASISHKLVANHGKPEMGDSSDEGMDDGEEKKEGNEEDWSDEDDDDDDDSDMDDSDSEDVPITN